MRPFFVIAYGSALSVKCIVTNYIFCNIFVECYG